MKNNYRIKYFLIVVFLVIPVSIHALTVTSAQLEICADDEFYAYINGSLVFETETIPGTDWQHTYTVDVSSFLFCGDYVLAINYYDTLASIINVTYKLTMHIDDGSTMIIYSDGINEKQTLNGNYLSGTQTFPGGWNTVGFDDSSWNTPEFLCTGARITDTAFTSGFVPYVSPYSGCGVPTAGQSVLIREPFSVLCPLVNITKSISKNVVSLGETITYCFNYSNSDAAPWAFNLWDTIPAVTDFVGCDSGCTTQTSGSNVVVSWPINVPAHGSGTVCAWVAANRLGLFKNNENLFFLPGRAYGSSADKTAFCDEKEIYRRLK